MLNWRFSASGGGGRHGGFTIVLTKGRYRTILGECQPIGIAAIVSQYRAVFGHVHRGTARGAPGAREK